VAGDCAEMMNTMGVARQCVAKLRDASGCASKAKIAFDYWFGIAQAEMGKESPGLLLAAVLPGCQTRA
jgi:hypothetical protein